MVKAGKAQIALRVDRVCRMLQNGVLPFEIVRYCREEYGVKDRQANEYIRKAKDLIFESISGEDRKQYAALMVATVHQILVKSMKDGNLACALGATAQLQKLTGLDSKQP